MPKDFIDHPNHWYRRAEETRAGNASDYAARKRLSQLATEFDRIALALKDRMNRTKDSQ